MTTWMEKTKKDMYITTFWSVQIKPLLVCFILHIYSILESFLKIFCIYAGTQQINNKHGTLNVQTASSTWRASWHSRSEKFSRFQFLLQTSTKLFNKINLISWLLFSMVGTLQSWLIQIELKLKHFSSTLPLEVNQTRISTK